MLSLDPIAHAYILTWVCVRSEDHLGGVGLNFTSEIIYLQPLDRSAAARDPVIYSHWSGSGSPDEGERRRFIVFIVSCWGFTTDNHPSFQ